MRDRSFLERMIYYHYCGPLFLSFSPRGARVSRVLFYSINVLLSTGDSPTAFSISDERRDRFNPPWINSRLFRGRLVVAAELADIFFQYRDSECTVDFLLVVRANV